MVRGEWVVKAVFVILLVGLGLLSLSTLPHVVLAWSTDESPQDRYLLSTIYVSGTIAVDTTWTTGNVYVVQDGDLSIASGATLTIEPGVVVKFNGDGPGGKYEIRNQRNLFVDGTLIAEGTETEPIYFTSLRDDAVGGDTNGDGGATTPEAGNWGRIEFSSSATSSVLDHVVVRYAGTTDYSGGSYPIYYAALLLRGTSPNLSDVTVQYNASDGIKVELGASPVITHCTISNNNDDGVHALGSSAPTIANSTISHNTDDGVFSEDDSLLTVSGSTISNNGGWPVSTLPAELPALNDNLFSGNGGNGIEIREGTISNDLTWPLLGHSYGVMGDVIVGAGATLTVEPGVVVKFNGDGPGGKYEIRNQRNLFVDGTLIAEGTETEPIYFTSLRDDAVGGDTNGDGGATTPEAGNWGRIEFSSSATSSVLDHVVVRYAGTTDYSGGSYPIYYAALLLRGTSPNLSDVTVQYNASDGIKVELGASPVITHCTISNNNDDGVHALGSSAPTIANSTISHNTDDGVYSEDDSLLTISGSTISNNGGWPVSTLPAELPALNDNLFSGNGGNGVEIREGTISNDLTWPLLGYPYGVMGDVTVGAGATLTIEPGVALKFRGEEGSNGIRSNLFVNGTLIARGTDAQRVYFTSLQDDSAQGDTNGDGGASVPEAGEWGRIEFTGSSVNSFIEYAIIRYGGRGSSDNYYGAVHVLGASPLISRTMFVKNVNGVWAQMLANPVIHYCKIEGNNSYGVRNDDSNALIDATYNWWNDPQGPSTESYTTPNGDKVSDYVDYDPWLTQSPFAPTVLGLSADELTNDVVSTIFITGTGFLPTPTVKLGNNLMSGVTWITTTQINFVIPVGFPVGTYELTIINPDGESTIVPDALTIRGSESYIYLPLVLKDMTS